MTDTGLDGKLAELALQYDDVTAQLGTSEVGRASCRERVFGYV